MALNRWPTIIFSPPPTRPPILIWRVRARGITVEEPSGLATRLTGTLTFGRTQLLSQSALGAYDPVASVTFFQIGFTALYSTFGASPTSRINTALTYRLTYPNFRVAAQAQVGGYNQENAATQQYQAQIGTDFRSFSFDAIAGYAINALTFQTFGGAPLPVGFDPNSIVRATALNTGGVELLGRYQWQKFKFYLGDIYSVSSNPSNSSFPNGVPSIAPGIFVPAGFVTTNAYTVPRILNTVWTGARYAMRSDLELASGVYWEYQNNFLAAPAGCTGSGTATSSSRCAGGRYSVSFLIDYLPVPRVNLYAGLLVSNVYGGVASGFQHTHGRPSSNPSPEANSLELIRSLSGRAMKMSRMSESSIVLTDWSSFSASEL